MRGLIIFAALVAGPLAWGGTTFTVANTASTAYLIDLDPNPTLDLLRGETYTFDIDASGHPFYIMTVPGRNTDNAYTNGVAGNGTMVGILTFTVPMNAPDTLYYTCSLHDPMKGTINIADPPPFVIESLDENGVITFSNINPNLFYRVEWTTNPDNTNFWRTDYTPLIDINATNETISVTLPRFFRIVAGTQMLIPDATNVRSGTIVQGVNGTFWEGDRWRYGPDTNTVIDNKTGLMWPANLPWFRTNWAAAVSFCESLSFAGFDDWRLPTRDELLGVCNSSGREDSLAAGSSGGYGELKQLADNYWSITEENDATAAYKVGINTGCSSGPDGKTATDNRFWPVRTLGP